MGETKMEDAKQEKKEDTTEATTEDAPRGATEDKNKETKELIERLEAANLETRRLNAEKVLAGETIAGQAPTKAPELTDEQYADAFLTGKVDGVLVPDVIKEQE